MTEQGFRVFLPPEIQAPIIVTFHAPEDALYNFKDFDFRLKPASAAVDRGMMIPNVTDGFTGTAPDLGALEVGQPLPTYGPRPVGPQ